MYIGDYLSDLSLPDVLNVSETADVLGISKNKMYEIIKSGKIHYFTIGKKILIPKLCINDFITSQLN